MEESTDIVVTFGIALPGAYDDADRYQKRVTFFGFPPMDNHLQLDSLGVQRSKGKGRTLMLQLEMRNIVTRCYATVL